MNYYINIIFELKDIKVFSTQWRHSPALFTKFMIENELFLKSQLWKKNILKMFLEQLEKDKQSTSDFIIN